MARKNTVLRIVLLVILSFVIGFGAYSCNAKRLTGNSLPMPFGIGMATVLSGSMEPDLSVNDVIIVKASDSYSVGETVVFQQGFSLVVHEIIEIDGDTVTTKGKANNTPDDPIKLSDIKGKVVFSIPKLGRAVSVIRSPIVTFIIIGAAAYLLVRSYRKEKEDDDRELDSIKAEIERLKNENKQDK